ncbi:hypothetical protein [Actinosynnema sp. NPDC023587]|uniref:hypothetical protein n=1 Tax=Actinosynnema sp. NPDC023587 TaxID=3154695 RepID=UPI0033CFBB0A
MKQNKPLSRKTWTALIVAALFIASMIGVLMGIFAAELIWLHYTILAALVIVAIVGFKLLGGFDQLETARRRNREDRP